VDYDVLGYGYYYLSGMPSVANNFENHLNCYKQSVDYFLKAGDLLRAAEVTNWIYDEYHNRGEYEKAFEYGSKAVELSIRASEGVSLSYQQFLIQYSFGNMSELYAAAGDYETAMDYLLHDNEFAITYKTGWLRDGNIAMLYCQMGKYDSAMNYWTRWSRTQKWGRTLTGHQAWGMGILGSIYLGKTEYEKALKIFKDRVDFTKKHFGFTPGDGLLLIAQVYNGKKDYKTALAYAKQGFQLVKEKDMRPEIVKGYQLLSSIYHKLGKNDSAYSYLSKYYSLKDSIQNKQFLLRLYDSKRQANEQKKSGQINLLNKDNQLKETKLRQQAFIRNSLIAGLILLLLTSIFLLRTFSLKRRNEKLKRLQLENDLRVQQLENEQKQIELQRQAGELEMQALRAQMNPHFIFNCLSSINRFIFKNDNKAASDYLTKFSRLIRMVLIHSQKRLIPLEDELEVLKLYLDMERLRFKNGFDYSITTNNSIDAGAIFIPPLLLQPFCENAIWHGLMHKDGHGHLNISITEEHMVLYCTIMDDGVGRRKAAQFKSRSVEKEKSLGLKITSARLALLNGEIGNSTSFQIEDVLDEFGNVLGTKVDLKITYKENVEQTEHA
jgi:tetratricopeptide (TPR) repeat protein